MLYINIFLIYSNLCITLDHLFPKYKWLHWTDFGWWVASLAHAILSDLRSYTLSTTSQPLLSQLSKLHFTENLHVFKVFCWQDLFSDVWLRFLVVFGSNLLARGRSNNNVSVVKETLNFHPKPTVGHLTDEEQTKYFSREQEMLWMFWDAADVWLENASVNI